MSDIEILERLVDQHARLGAHPEELFKVETPDQAFERAREILASLVDATESRLRRGPPPDSVVKWALDHRSAVLGETCVIPLVGLHGPLGWIEARSPLDPKTLTAAATDWISKIAAQLAAVVEHVQLKHEADRLRDLFDGILECIPHAIVTVDQACRVIELNSNAEVLFRVRRIDVLDEPVEKALPPAAAQLMRGIAVDVMARRSPVEHELEYELDARTKLPLAVTGAPLSVEPRGVVFLCRDLRATRELDKLRQLDAMKSDFAHAVTHGLKTPLTSILGGLQLLEQSKLDPDRAELVAMIDHGARRLQTLVRDILTISKLEAGQAATDRRPTDLAALVRAAAAPFKAKVKAVKARVACDEAQVREILENLLSNAAKYSKAPPEISLTKSTSGFAIAVRDHGIGIPAADLPHVFEKFHRAANAVKLGVDGTGLGLAITRRLAELQGWTVALESAEGKGTTVVISIPHE